MKNSKKYKIVFIIIFMIIITFPYLNSLLHVVKDEQLYGITDEISEPIYSIKSYLNGEYQKDFDTYYAENFPYRNIFIKCYNQLRYDIFKQGYAIIGKENYLFEELYVNEYLGINTVVSEEYLNDLVKDIKAIQDICNNNGKEFYVIITPSKAEFCSEYIPDKYYEMAKNVSEYTRNYDIFVPLLQSEGIKYYDSPKFFRENEENIKVPLYYKTGIHWSYAASSYVLREFINYIDNTSTLNLRNFEIVDIQTSNDIFEDQSTDSDLFSLLNIFNKDKEEIYYKTILNFENGNIPNKKLFMQGGSFSWHLTETMTKNIFSEIDFMFYRQFIRHYDKNGNTVQEEMDDNNVTKEILDEYLRDKDIIILEVNQEYLDDMGAGFPKILRQYLEEYGFPEIAKEGE